MKRRLTGLVMCLLLVLSSSPIWAAEPIEMPIVPEPLELTTFVEFDPTKAGGAVSSYSEIAAYRKMAEISNIHMKFRHPPVGQHTEQFNLMIASGNYPDIIEWNWLNFPGGPERAIQQGIIIPLNNLIDQYAPNLKRIFEEHPEAYRQAITDDGTLYMFPFLRLSDSWRIINGFQVNQAWLDAVGLDKPQTIDDWYVMLTAFKEHDLAGDGNTIPYTAQGLDGLTPFLGAWGLSYGFYHVDHVVHYGPAQPEFRDWLETMHRWYSEGLIDPDFASVDSAKFDARIAGNRAGAWYGLLSGHLGRLTQLNRATNPYFTITGVPHPIGPLGVAYDVSPERIRYVPGPGAAITTANRHVVETVKYLDYGYSPEGHLLMVYGIEGESYEMVDGRPRFTEIITNHPDYSIDIAMGPYSRGTGSPPLVFDHNLFEQRIFLPEQHAAQAEWAKASTDRILPPITMTPEEGRRFVSIMTDIQTYVDEMTANFIIGRVPLNQFDAFQNTLRAMGIDEAVAIQQAALDRYLRR